MTASVAEVATVAHGYTMADLDRAATVAVRKFRRSTRILDDTDCFESAWHQIAVTLCESATPPPFTELVIAGYDGISQALTEEYHHQGFDQSRGREMPSFTKFWAPLAGPPDFTERLVEREALPQVLALLTAKQYEVVAALAVYGKMPLAAQSLGIEASVAHSRLTAARKKIHEAWMAPETPQRRLSAVERSTEPNCGSGHSRAVYGRRDKSGKWYCKECNRLYHIRARARRDNAKLAADREVARLDQQARRARRRSELEAEPQTLAQAHGATPATVHRHATEAS